MKIEQEEINFKPVKVTIETVEELQLIRIAINSFKPNAITGSQTHHCDIRLNTIDTVSRLLDSIKI